MKKSLLALLVAFTISGCGESDSKSSSPVPPTYKDTLTFIENSTPYGALIFEDATTLDKYSTQFSFALENLTANPYNNITLAVEPADSAKYSIVGNEYCTTLSLRGYCLFSVKVNTKTEDDINFKIKMNSDRGELTFTPATIKANYKIQPNVKALSFSGAEPMTFLVSNMTPFNSRLVGDIVLENTRSSDTRTLEFVFENGTENSGNGFEIVQSDVTKEFALNGQAYNFKNCFATSTKTSINNMGNSDASACYVEVKFANTTPGTYTNTLTIKPIKPTLITNLPWKSANIALSATTN